MLPVAKVAALCSLLTAAVSKNQKVEDVYTKKLCEASYELSETNSYGLCPLDATDREKRQLGGMIVRSAFLCNDRAFYKKIQKGKGDKKSEEEKKESPEEKIERY